MPEQDGTGTVGQAEPQAGRHVEHIRCVGGVGVREPGRCSLRG